MKENKQELVICPKVLSLQCFLEIVKGRKCGHSEPHKHHFETCTQSICVSVNDEKIINCKCVPYKGE